VSREWHSIRVEAAEQALQRAAAETDRRRAELALSAADDAAGGIVPREDFERLALDYSARNVDLHQTEDLLGRALEALDAVAAAGEHVPKHLRDDCFVTAVEIRAMLDARRDEDA
jgi:hypothetical protein